jgi:hypothetical protein
MIFRVTSWMTFGQEWQDACLPATQERVKVLAIQTFYELPGKAG